MRWCLSAGRHKSCFPLTICFSASLYHLLASFTLIRFTWTVSAGNLVALEGNLRCGDENTFSLHSNKLSLSTEMNPVSRWCGRERVERWRKKVDPPVSSGCLSLSFPRLLALSTRLYRYGTFLFRHERFHPSVPVLAVSLRLYCSLQYPNPQFFFPLAEGI